METEKYLAAGIDPFGGARMIALMQTRIRQIRLQRGLTQEQLGHAAGLSQGIISRVETGKDPEGRVDTYQRIADALGVGLAEIFVRKNNDPTLAEIYDMAEELPPENRRLILELGKRLLKSG